MSFHRILGALLCVGSAVALVLMVAFFRSYILQSQMSRRYANEAAEWQKKLDQSANQYQRQVAEMVVTTSSQKSDQSEEQASTSMLLGLLCLVAAGPGGWWGVKLARTSSPSFGS